MVNKDVVNYLKEGKKRGFSFQLLKQKLLEGGFEDKEISEAIAELNGIESANLQNAPVQQLAQQKVTPQYNSPSAVSQAKPLQTSVQGTSQLNTQQKTSPPSQINIAPKSSPPIQQPQKPSALIQGQQPAQQKVTPQVQPAINNPLFSMQNKSGSTGLWAKISGILGIALLIFLLTFSFVVLSLDNNTVFLFYLVIIIIFSGVYLLGFYKIGNHTESKLLKLGSLVMIVLLVLFLIISLTVNLTGNKFIPIMLSLSSDSGSGLSVVLSMG